MGLRDLGYKPYQGARASYERNTLVLYRFSLRRAWASTLVKIATFVAPLLGLVAAAYVGIVWYISQQTGMPSQGVVGAQRLLSGFLALETWLIVAPVCAGGGASAIAEDLSQRAFMFFFSKPVTATQYVVARFGAIATWLFCLLLGSALLPWIVLVGTTGRTAVLEYFGLLLPILGQSALISLAAASISVGLSSLGSSRALTMSAWILLFFVPHVIAFVIHAAANTPWVYMASLPRLLSTVGDAAFKVVDTAVAMKWFHALPVLVVLIVGSFFAAHSRASRAEVIT